MRYLLLSLLFTLFPLTASADVAFDAASVSSAGTSTLSWTHTPVGTPRGVLCGIAQNVGTGDEVTSVTYGGDTMTEVALSPSSQSSGEDNSLYMYFLGTSIPTGAQTVTVNVDATGSNKIAACYSLTASADTEMEDTSVHEASSCGTAVNVTVSLNGNTSFVGEVIFSSANDPSDNTPLSNWTDRGEHDFLFQTAGFYTYDTIGTADVTAGYTGASGQHCHVLAGAVTESAAAGGLPAGSLGLLGVGK